MRIEVITFPRQTPLKIVSDDFEFWKEIKEFVSSIKKKRKKKKKKRKC